MRSLSQNGPFQGKVHAQIETLVQKESANSKPYWELKLRDAAGSLILRAWNDSPAFSQCSTLAPGLPIEVIGEFFYNIPYGLEARRWEIRPLSETESRTLFQGEFSTEEDFNWIQQAVEKLKDPRLRELAVLFLKEFGPRFCRAAAARHMHHAHRGGLCKHTAQMMRMATQIATIYPTLNHDLLVTGALFHDCGKLWEVCPPEQGFSILYNLRGELIGHIPIGIELINTLWRKLPLDLWKEILPPSEDVHLHLLHLVASHHGEYEFGSPVLPKTPEAITLHHIDNLDAKLEMLAEAYRANGQVAPAVFEKCRPLNVAPISPLPLFEEEG